MEDRDESHNKLISIPTIYFTKTPALFLFANSSIKLQLYIILCKSLCPTAIKHPLTPLAQPLANLSLARILLVALKI